MSATRLLFIVIGFPIRLFLFIPITLVWCFWYAITPDDPPEPLNWRFLIGTKGL